MIAVKKLCGMVPIAQLVPDKLELTSALPIPTQSFPPRLCEEQRDEAIPWGWGLLRCARNDVVVMNFSTHLQASLRRQFPTPSPTPHDTAQTARGYCARLLSLFPINSNRPSQHGCVGHFEFIEKEQR